ncbi:hypothetical protein ASU33_07265 [Solirubrum puertoriconensis]|uniref:Uncharacterized protein n=1 Tax=Solirubrum puertoriconensis TaxID=1751427 RepID=A0A9X0HL56_SOLP1|nr:hypothetical protein ASU33_07265 [Solirubrum puertoriconensis]
MLGHVASFAQSSSADHDAATPVTVAVASSAAQATLLSDAELDAFLLADTLGHNLAEPVLSSPEAAASSQFVGLSAKERYQLGQADARKHYKPSKGAFWITFGATSIAPFGAGPLLGLASGTVIAATPPGAAKLNAPHPELLQDADYYRGYRKQAQARRTGKAAAGFGVAIGMQAALVLLLATQGL